jgi:hypothetical protein
MSRLKRLNKRATLKRPTLFEISPHQLATHHRWQFCHWKFEKEGEITMRLLVAALFGSLILVSATSHGFAQNQQGQGSQASGSSSGITGQTGNQGNDKPVGNAGGTRQ